MSHDIILSIDFYLWDIVFITRYFKYLISYIDLSLTNK